MQIKCATLYNSIALAIFLHIYSKITINHLSTRLAYFEAAVN